MSHAPGLFAYPGVNVPRRPPLLMLAIYLAILLGGLALGCAWHWPGR